jgi:hypothetical protein
VAVGSILGPCWSSSGRTWRSALAMVPVTTPKSSARTSWGCGSAGAVGYEGLLGEGERGRVSIGLLAGGRPAPVDIEFSVALGLVRDC